MARPRFASPLGDFLLFLADHRLLWLAPVALGLVWLAVLLVLQALDDPDFTYPLS